jgi:hypothetical protein
MSPSFLKPAAVFSSLAALGLAALTLTSPDTFAADKKPKYTVEQIMEAINKGDDNICKRVIAGKASKEDIAKLVECYSELPHNKPPKGDQKSWDEKTAALVKAVNGIKTGAPDAVAKFKEAVNCKACHSAHKPD